jgi:ABC-type sugar transport system ATPase subunit
MADVSLHGIAKSFGATEILRDINLSVADGEFVVFVGPSGCGKSTLLRIIAGLETVSGGEIRIGSRRVNELPPADRKIAMVFQSYALYPHMNVYKNMAFGLKFAKTNKAEVERRVRQAAEILKLTPLLDRKPRELSGGQRQRVAIGRAIVRNPSVFLFDEPLSNLDAALRVNTRLEIAKLHRDLGATMIYVTHDQVEAMGMGHRIAVIDSGRVRQLGTPREIYEYPADTFVATFLGSPPMNLIPHGNTLIGFRPENFHPAEPGQAADASSHLQFTLEHIREEYLGSEKLIYGEVQGTKAVSRVAANHPVSHAMGSSATFVVNRRDVRMFDTESGLAMDEQPPQLISPGAPTGQVTS